MPFNSRSGIKQSNGLAKQWHRSAAVCSIHECQKAEGKATKASLD